jgi:hypothetical protein
MAGPYLLAHGVTSGASTTVTATLASTPAAGDAVLAFIATNGGVFSSLADSKSGTWALVVAETTDFVVNVYRRTAGTALTTSDTVTYTATASGEPTIALAGVPGFSSVDKTGTGLSASTAAPTASTAATTAAPEMVVAYFVTANGAGGTTWAGGWTSLLAAEHDTTSLGPWHTLAWQAETVTGIVTASGTTSVAGKFGGVLVTAVQVVTAGLATGTGSALAPAATVAVTAALAPATGVAQAATAPRAVTAGLASATGLAQSPAAAIAGPAGLASATGLAQSPAAAVAAATGLATATGTALPATVTTSGSTSAAAGLASATGLAQSPAAAVAASAGLAAAAGIARVPSSAIAASAGLASAMAAALAAAGSAGQVVVKGYSTSAVSELASCQASVTGSANTSAVSEKATSPASVSGSANAATVTEKAASSASVS